MQHVHLFPLVADYLKAIIINGGYTIIFITTFLEGVPLVGMAVPGHVAIILAGFLAKIGTLNLYWVIIISAVGAILGDFFGFFLGRRYGLPLIDKLRPYFFIRNEHIEKAQKLLHTHTGKAMLVGRFSPMTRAIMPFLVGTNKTSSKKFWLFNIIGGVSWVVTSVGIGYLFGASYHGAASLMGKSMVIALIAVALILWAYRFVNVRFRTFAKYEIFTLMINVFSLLILAWTLQDAFSPHSFWSNFDIWINIFSSERVTPFVVILSHYISFIGSTQSVIALTITISVSLAIKRKWRRCAFTLLSIISTGTFLGLFKDYFMRARPENAFEILSSYSFPSGHAAFAAAFLVVIGYLLATHIKSWVKRELVLVLCFLIMILIGLSRIVLNVHWASDVIGGWALGAFMATSSILFVRYVGSLMTRKKHGNK